MHLTPEEEAMRAGELGPVRQRAIEHQLQVGTFFGAADFVPVTQAHIMADTESLGEACIAWLEQLAAYPAHERRVRIPTITDPRGTDFSKACVLKHAPWMLDLERRAIDALRALGVLMTDTCINYQTVLAATFGEHVAFGDTGVVIYSNSVSGARSNFEGGPSAVAAGLTGRTPRYGFHLDAQRQPTLRVRVDDAPRTWNDWGALGGVIGRLAGNYWAVPYIEGLADAGADSNALKHFGAAMASFGSVAMFHIEGVTPEAHHARDFDLSALPSHRVSRADIDALQAGYRKYGNEVDVVVFSAPQLSLIELGRVADLLDGRQVKKPLLAITSPQVKPDADRMGLTERIEASGAHVLAGMCFYQSYAREMREANGWARLATNSAKMVNILGGYGYQPMLASMEDCVEAACTGALR